MSDPPVDLVEKDDSIVATDLWICHRKRAPTLIATTKAMRTGTTIRGENFMEAMVAYSGY